MINTIYKNRQYNITKKQEIAFHLFIVHHALRDCLFAIFYLSDSLLQILDVFLL